MSALKIVAEIGCNHQGSFETAIEMIDVAAGFCKAHYVKFQKRSNRELLPESVYNGPHPNPMHAYGATYGEHRERLEFTVEQHARLKAYCAEKGIGYATSVWDLTSAREIAALEPDYIKIPSATNLNFDLLGWLCDHYSGEIHLSLGMTTPEEETAIITFLQERGRLGDTVLYACTSGYPVPFDELCLLEITRLRNAYEGRVRSIGFSGHHNGIAADVAAQTLGAAWIERHYTLDRTWKGTDHAASLEPDGLRRLVRNAAAIAQALQSKSKPLLDIELPQRAKLKWQKPD